LGASNFEAGGGDGYTVLAAIPSTTSYVIEADALLGYIVNGVGQATITPATNSRIVQNP
jgi:hypothetical protein